MPVIIGIDPGLAESGWGVIERGGSGRLFCLSYGCIKTASGLPPPQRLLLIHEELNAVIEKWKPEAGAIESLYFARNVKSALPVAQARGVLCMTMAKAGLPVREYSPNEIKLAVSGTARAEKHQVQEMVRIILGLKEAPDTSHSADALAAAICCSNSFNPLTNAG